MNTRPLDKSKKSNIKCEHCTSCLKDSKGCYCLLHDKPVNYWNRCKEFAYDVRYL